MAASKFNFCPSCGKPLQEDFKHCPYCGQDLSDFASSNKNEKLDRSPKNTPEFLIAIGRFLKFIGRYLQTIFNRIWDWVKENAPDIFRRILSFFGKFFSLIGGFLLNVAVSFIDWIKEKTQNLEKRRQDPEFRAKQNPQNSFSGFFRKIWKTIKAFFTRISNLLQDKVFSKFEPKVAQKLSIATTALTSLVVIGLVASLFFRGPSSKEEPDQLSSSGAPDNEASITAVATPNETTVDPADQTWLVMIYSDADDQGLEKALYFDINEAEVAGSSDRVSIVAQVDRFNGGFNGDGDWTGTRRYFIEQDNDLQSINSEMVADLGELDMANPEVFIDFATWAIKTYPADNYVLIMSDHGSGWTGGWYDDDPTPGNFILLSLLDKSLDTIISQTGIGKFELIGMDACLMSMFEVYNMLEPYAKYAVASEEYEPSMGWAYSEFLSQLIAKPEMSTTELANAIVDSYISSDLTILDDNARLQLLSDLELPDDTPADALARGYNKRATLSAIDLSLIPQLNASFDQLLINFKEVDQSFIAEARAYAQPFMNIFDDGKPSPYIDLYNFLSYIKNNISDTALSDQIAEFKTLYQQTTVAEKHGENHPGATGISIYFPISNHYWEGGLYSQEYYASIANRFSENTLWDDFLAFHYAEQDFGQDIDQDSDQEEPEQAGRVRAPGSGIIEVSDPIISPGTVTANRPAFNIEAEVNGNNIAYLYQVTLYQYQDRFLFYEFDYIPADKNKDNYGVVYPDWNTDNGAIRIDVNNVIQPSVVTDGTTAAFVVMEPDKYGVTPQDRIYAVKGFYIYADTGRKVSARMYFNNDAEGQIRNIVGYFGPDENNPAPAEIIPRRGDQFQFVDTWWEPNEDGGFNDILTEGNVLTFGDTPFRHGIYETAVEAGVYHIGIMAEDYDGNQFFNFSPVIVE